MVNKIKAKNVELYIGHIDTSSLDFSSRANDTTLASFVNTEVDSGITDWLKISNGTTELSIEPSEDSFETVNYFGVDANGVQNASSESVFSADVDVTITKAEEISNSIKKYILEDKGITNATYSDYESYNWGDLNTEDLIIVARKQKLINGTYHMGTIVMISPKFKKPQNFGGSADDASINSDLTLFVTKGNIEEDFYTASAAESLDEF